MTIPFSFTSSAFFKSLIENGLMILKGKTNRPPKNFFRGGMVLSSVKIQFGGQKGEHFGISPKMPHFFGGVQRP
jgi:hypothetical protein